MATKQLPPLHWAGRYVDELEGEDRVFVCGACSDPKACAEADACARHLASPGNCGCRPGECPVCDAATQP